MAFDLGTLHHNIEVDMSSMERAEMRVSKFERNVSRKFKAVERSGKRMASAGKAMTAGLTAPLLGIGIASLKMSNDFNKGMAEVNSLLGEADRDLAGLKKTVKGVADSLGIDLTDAAGAAYQAISASVPKDNLGSFLEVAGKASIAGVTDLETAVDGLTTVTNAWGDSAGSAADISDVMFTAVQRGKTTFEELSRSMFQAANLAPELGVQFKEVAAATATMTKQGVPTSVAMTQMQRAMTALAKPNKDMEKLIKASGIESVKASIKLRGLAGTYDLLRKSAEDGGINFEQAVGSVEALGFVLKTTGKNTEKFQEDLQAMSESTGAMESAFKELDDARGFEKLITSLKSMAVTIGDALMPVILPLVEKFSGWISKANELDPNLINIGVALGAVAAAAGPVLMVVGSLVSTLAPLIASAGGLKAAMIALASASGPVALVIAAIAAYAYLIYKNWDALKTFFKKAVDEIVGFFQGWMAENQELVDGIIEEWNGLVEAGSEFFGELWNVIKEVSAEIVKALDEMLEPIGGLEGAWEILKTALSMYMTSIGEAVKALFSIVKETFKFWTEVLKGNIDLWQVLKDSIALAKEAIGKKLYELTEEFVKLGESIISTFKEIDWKQLGIDIVNGIIKGIQESGGALKDAVWNMSRDALNGAKEFLKIQSPSRVFADDVGRYIPEGLAMGINNHAGVALDAATRMADGVSGTVKDRLAQLSSDLMSYGQGAGGYGIDSGFEEERSMEQARYQEELELLKSAEEQKLSAIAPYHELREKMEKRHQDNLMHIERARTDARISMAQGFFGQLAQMQDSNNKKLAAVGKAAAVAQATIDTYRSANAAYASMAGIPVVGPALGAAAAGAAIAAGMANVAAIRSSKATGGEVFSGGMYRVNEQGPELLSTPSGDFLMTGSERGTITPNHKLGGGRSETNVYVNVQNNTGAEVSVEERGQGAEKEIRILIEKAKESVASDIERGTGSVTRALSGAYKLRRTG